MDNQHIEELSLASNALKTLPKNVFKKMTNLRVLDVSANALTEIAPEFVGANLVRVFFAYNKLTGIPDGIFNKHRSLQEVDLSGNQIMMIDSAAFDDMVQLKNISLGINKITKIDRRWFRGTNNLRRVHLVRNDIEEVPDEAFSNIYNENLEVIDLDENSIKRVSPVGFKGLRKIGSLRLSINNIDKWDASFLADVENIDLLDLSSNRIGCPEGDFNQVFKAVSTDLKFNPLNPECVEKIKNWKKLDSSNGHIISTNF